MATIFDAMEQAHAATALKASKKRSALIGVKRKAAGSSVFLDVFGHRVTYL